MKLAAQAGLRYPVPGWWIGARTLSRM